ncbi:unnamed protein product [Nezara viridula]|uniref:Cytochrome P450 n=1 Tax=Nezara viridula TaxID=85310 RepID=A0A9P0MKX0_NEZVI|nr:unnamed protein product [Nezara viridula]
MLFGVTIIAGLLWLFYKHWVSVYTHWKEKGIPFHPAKFPFGSHPNLVKLKEYRGYTIDKMYHRFAPHPMFGIFFLRSPMLIVRDPETIQLILTKEFSHFRDRRILKISEKDVLNHHLFYLQGEKWRDLRMKLTPTFTSGKLKAMFPLFISCAESFSSLLLSKSDSKIDIKELMSRFTADVICSCAFGLELDVINHPDSKLRMIGIEKIKLQFLQKLKMAATILFPALSTLLNMRFTSLEDEKYILNLVKKIVEQREKNGIVRNDFIDLLMQSKNKGNQGDNEQEFEKTFEITLELMAAQCYVFFLAGFETSSSLQSFCLYELALHQDIQSRLIKEINEKIENNNGLTYKALHEMEYLDMIISGMRFGLLQTKVGIVTLLQKCKVETCEDTKIPLVMGGISATTAPDEPIIIKLIARS